MRLDLVIASPSGHGAHGSQQVVAIEELAIPERRVGNPSIDGHPERLLPFGQGHTRGRNALDQGPPPLILQRIQVEGQSRSDADLSKTFEQFLLVRVDGLAKWPQGVQVPDEAFVTEGFIVPTRSIERG